MLKFYSGVITGSRLQVVNTLIDTFFSINFVPFQKNKEEKGRSMMVIKKLDGTVDESSSGQ